MSYDFSGQRALVTGAGAGIGRATALKLAQMGAKVYALSKTQANLDSLKAENPSIEIICVDLADWTTTREAVKKITPIHLLVNNAAMAVLDTVLNSSPEMFDNQFNVNVKSLMNVTQVVAGDLVSRNLTGSIVNVSSQASLKAFDDHMVYCATKAAVDAMTRSMALELGRKGIRVNSVNPTVVKTAMGLVGWSKKEKSEPLKARIPLNRFAEVDEVVDPILFLLSSSSSMINGAFLPIDGGFLAT